ncbi:pentapeptide repeat-containing protein [Erythrobacter crassostreae]|uniref:Pentapeptide repeat-containing protein n=1 Tax=Erythrobacter crassostreae TaxID=2828328 RepID=A0A9X1F1S5_9SPHN|nr:pentapeptide repeat-containing protein [Erythrobacter crassostrea]MBV7257959.1 pentapeptide repeat-containing protein [Erythrobacter crassostrea]
MNTVRRASLMLAALTAGSAIMPELASAKGLPAESCKQLFDHAKAGSETIFPSEASGDFEYLDGAELHTPDMLRAALKRIRSSEHSGAKTPVVLIARGNFDGWLFQGTNPDNLPVCFNQSSLAGSNWENADYPGVGFLQSDLTDANFRRARIENAIFHDSALTNAIMQDAFIKGGRFSGSWARSVTNWDLSGSDLTQFVFDCGITIGDGCTLERDGIKFAYANLEKADISSFPTWGTADFDGAVFKSTKIAPKQIRYLVGINPVGTIVLHGGNERSYLTKSHFQQLHALSKIVVEEKSEPSFQCSDARTIVEKLICGEYETRLRTLDRRMTFLYTNGWPHHSPGLQPQRAWLKERNKCEDADCVETAYNDRINAVLAANGEPMFLDLGESAYFIPDTIGLPKSIIGSELYERIVPAVAGEAMASVRITRELDGTYSAIGQSIGANAHICSLSGTSLSFDSTSGWFSSTDEGSNSWPLFQIIRDELTIYKNGRFSDSRPENSSAFVSCGARAYFPDMQRIFYDTEKLAALIAFPDD